MMCHCWAEGTNVWQPHAKQLQSQTPLRFDHPWCRKWWLGDGCKVCFGNKKGFNIGFHMKQLWGKVLPSTTANNHSISDMMTVWTLMSWYSYHWPPFGTSKRTCSILHHGQCRCALFWDNSSDWSPRNTNLLTKWCGWGRRGRYGNGGCHDRRRQRRCDRLHRGRWRE